jgi:hypothetical protein
MVCDGNIEHGTPGGFPFPCYVQDADGYRLPYTLKVDTETGDVEHYGTWPGGQFHIDPGTCRVKTFRKRFKAPLQLVPVGAK